MQTAPAPRALVGRDDALAVLRAALTPGAVLTVVGLPGVGKSALLAAVAHAHRDAAAHVWVDLAPATTPGDLWGALGAALGLTLTRPEDGYAHVTAALAGRGAALVVLDAAEHLDAEGWRAVAGLPRDLPGVAWAVTSVVRPPGEMRVFELAPLDADAAVELLVARSRERALDQAPDPADPVWGVLAERLDGLPLALELAAGRFGVLTPTQILERLDRPGLLAGGRHGTLSGALRYAWGLLGPEDRAALAACCVFHGGFDVAAAEAVLGDDALDRLTTLRERSALAWRDGRFHLLDGLRRLAEAEGADVIAAARVRHHAWYGAYGVRLREGALGADPKAASAALRREQANLEAAFHAARTESPETAAELARTLIRSWWMHGPLWRADVLGDLTDIARAVPLELGAETLAAWGGIRRGRGDLPGAARALDLAVELAEASGVGRAISWACSERASLHLMLRESAPARRLLQRAAATADTPLHAMQALNFLGQLERAEGDADAAADAYLAALGHLGPAGSLRARIVLQINLGIVRCEQRRYAEARALYEAAIAAAPEDPHLHFEAHLNLAELAVLQGDGPLADVHLAPFGPDGVRRGAEVDGEVATLTALRRWAGGDAEGAVTAFLEAIAHTQGPDPVACARARAFMAVLVGGPGASADVAAARAAGCPPGLLDVLDAWIAGQPLPEAPATEAVEGQIARALHARTLGPAWKVDGEGRWFERPGGRVDLARRGAMRRMFAALVAARRERPGVGLSVEELFAAGWPGEAALPESAAGRVYTAIRELRALGLEPVLRRHAEGYLMDPTVRLAVV